MNVLKQIGNVLVKGILILSLVGVLTAYLIVVSDLPSRVYTPAQREYLVYNARRSVYQLPPNWSVVQPGGDLVPTTLRGQDSRVRATLIARYEELERVSVTVYDLVFYGEYRLTHADPQSTTVELFFPFPDNLETLHEVHFTVDGEEPPDAHYTTRGIGWRTVLETGEERQIAIGYQADGANSFAYSLQHDQRSDLDITLAVQGLSGSDVPEGFLPPSASEVTEEGEVWTWNYAALIPERDIQLNLPRRSSFAQRVARLQDDFRALAGLAPLLVGLFLVSLAGVLYLSGVRLRLESYLLAGCGLALFYPLLTFLSGMVTLALAAALSTLLVAGLLLAFLGLTIGWQQARWRVGLLLVIFLGFFSLGALSPWRGLLLTAGGLLLVGTFMLLYAHRPAIPQSEPELSLVGVASVLEPDPAPGATESEPDSDPTSDQASSGDYHCPYCARELSDDYSFCPGCGHDTSRLHRCPGCGHQQLVPVELEAAYCVHCGESLPERPRG